MRRNFLLLACAGLALSLPAAAQLTTTPFSQTNGNATPFPSTPSLCATYVSSYGIDLNGNAQCFVPPALSLTGQTTAMTNTVLCAAASCPAGLYQLVVNAVPTTTATVGTMSVSVAFTDDAQAQSIPMITGLSLLSKNTSSATYTLYSTGTVPITISTALLSVTGSPAYSVRAFVRRLF